MKADDGLAITPFATAAAWDLWLAQHGESERGVWIRIAKKASGIQSVTYAEALDVALCRGWIDGTRKGYDDEWFIQRFTPRGPRSNWSRVNVDKVAALTAAGRMHPEGERHVDLAKADGRWDRAYAAQSVIEVPPDLAAALDANRAARELFDTLDSRNRYAILYRVQEAKRSDTRERRIAGFVDMLARGKTLYPPRRVRGTPKA